MICQPCSEGEHERCDDVQHHQNYVEWLQATYGGIEGEREGVVVGPEELAVIRANRPYASCPCHHQGSTVVEAARSGESFEG